MRKPKTITLLIAGAGLLLTAPMMMIGSDCIRPVRDASGQYVMRPDGKVLFEYDTIAQIKLQWLPELMATVGLTCLIWAAIRGARYLYDRVHNKAA
jgi:hypothetical protein